jgi:hypothetical protein
MSRRALDELGKLERDGLVQRDVAGRLRTWYERRDSEADARAKEVLGAAQLAEQLVPLVRSRPTTTVTACEHAPVADAAANGRPKSMASRRDPWRTARR